jgi:peptidoglycan/xylan/chitin deacetylase (PgdA/CDA1 family)
MRGKSPLLSCVIAGVLGVSAGSWPEIRARALTDADPPAQAQLTALFADQKWAAPATGSWRPPQKSGDRLPAVVSRIETSDKVVFLTIDDGYEYDAAFVDIVRGQRVPILTFLTTSYVKGHAQYFWAMRHAGSQIEDHTVSHPNMATLPAAAQKREICRSADTITTQYGRRPQIFRPPFGSYNQVTRKAAADCGMRSIMLWSAEFYNGTTSPRGVPNEFARADGGTGFKPGDIILMHYRKGLAKDFTTLLGQIREQGFRPAAVQNYLPASLGGTAPG